MTTIFPPKLKPRGKSRLLSTTVRGFAGGLNVVDDELLMAPRFLTICNNFYRTSSGSQRLRFGNSYMADLANVISNELGEDATLELREDTDYELREVAQLASANAQILDMIAFSNRIVVVTTNGYVATMNALGDVDIIWTPAIAAALPGAPGFWSSGLTLITFVPHKNSLVVHNGVDKPISISSTFAVTYLQDLATGSNVNVPIGKYGCVAANYHCVAGIPGSPTQIVISSKGTAGTFIGDPAPNDSISIDVGAYAPEGATEIYGIAGYKSFLIVFLEGISLQVRLGVYDDTGNHTPEFPDDFPNFGLIGSRCILKVETDLLFCGLKGVTDAKRSIMVSGQLESNIMSSIIEPLYQNKIGLLTDTQRRIGSFTVYDALAHTAMLFIPGGDVIVYSMNEKLRYKAWSTYSDMDWTCGCTSKLGRVFVAKGSKIFQIGNNTFGEKYYADRMNDRDTDWKLGTLFTVGQKVWDRVGLKSYTCNVSHTSRVTGDMALDRDANPSFWTEYTGIAIDFEFETPWFDGKEPMKTKKLRFISIGSKGTAEFNVKAYVDNLYKDVDGNILYDPATTLDLVGNDTPGFGIALSDDPFGTGRRSRDPRLLEFACKFKTIKFNVSGSTKKSLEIMTFSYLFARGSYQRG